MLMTALLAILWLAACKTTPEPSSPVPQSPKTQETAKTLPPPSSETQQPDPGGTPSEATKDQKPPTQSTIPPEQAPAESAPAPPAKSQDTAESKLEKARDDLRVSRETEKKVAAQLEQLKKSENASAEEIRNYETYHERVKDMVAENQKMVEEMERAYSQHPSSQSPVLSDQPIPEERTQDPVAELDRQLDASLTEFDGTLIKEMEKIQTASTAKMRDLAKEAAEAAKRAKGRGGESEAQDEDSEYGDQSDKESNKKKKSDSEKSAEPAEQREGGDEEAREIESTGDNSRAGKGKGEYGREDEDIVARQLREAAENETDPELKKKLWEEYEEYMKNSQ
jgi:hypothetical protein